MVKNLSLLTPYFTSLSLILEHLGQISWEMQNKEHSALFSPAVKATNSLKGQVVFQEVVMISTNKYFYCNYYLLRGSGQRGKMLIGRMSRSISTLFLARSTCCLNPLDPGDTVVTFFFLSLPRYTASVVFCTPVNAFCKTSRG